jgi:FkbM family methyltransferase
VLSQLGFKSNGYFVEFGATNGIDLSNTYLLEKEFGWTGILAEPAHCWHSKLHQNRSVHIETDCIWSNSSTTLTFNESDNPDLSTISSFSDADHHGKLRKNVKSYEVKTISLNDLLDKFSAPAQIDYLSIDTEGSEFEILSHFDFSRHRFSVITCEHNFTPMRDRIFDLLTRHGYIRIHQDISGVDDWYIHSSE